MRNSSMPWYKSRAQPLTTCTRKYDNNMPPLKNPRHEQFAQLLSQPHPPSLRDAYLATGGTGRHADQHASRIFRTTAVANRIQELQTRAGEIAARALARAEANAVSNIEVSRKSLLEDAATAFKVAEQQGNAQAMCQAIRLLADLALIPMKAPEDKPAAQQHLHVHEMIDRPPQESLEQWLDRKNKEAADRATSKQMKLVG